MSEMAGDKAKCWACNDEVDVKLLTRLDNVVSLAGFAPGTVKTGHHRICANCLFRWAQLRLHKEQEIGAFLSSVSSEPPEASAGV